MSIFIKIISIYFRILIPQSALGELLLPAFVRRRASSVVRKLFYLNIFSSETTHWVLTKLHRNDPWVVPYQSCSNRFSGMH